MTELEGSARDELLSVYLDREASKSEQARVETDPELISEIEAYRKISRMIAEPAVGPETALRTNHIAVAVQAFAPTSKISVFKDLKIQGRPLYARVLGAAAVIVIVLLLTTLLFIYNQDGDTSAVSIPLGETANEAIAANPSQNLEESLPSQQIERNSGPPPTTSPSGPLSQPSPASAPVHDRPEIADEVPQTLESPNQNSNDLPPLTGVPIQTHSIHPNLDTFIAEVNRSFTRPKNDQNLQASEASTNLLCSAELKAAAGDITPDKSILFVGDTTIGNEDFEYLVFQNLDEKKIVVLETSGCTAIATVALL